MDNQESCVPAVAGQCCIAIPDLGKAVNEFRNDAAKSKILVKALSLVLGGPLSHTLVTTLPCSELMDRLRDLDTFAEDIIKYLEDRPVEAGATA